MMESPANLAPALEAADVRELRPKRAERPRCGAQCRSRLELVGAPDGALSELAARVRAALDARGGRATMRALAELGPLGDVRTAARELVVAGVAAFASCAAHVVVERDAAGVIRVRSRCRLHGGCSTGARTAEGRARLVEAGRNGAAERWRRWRIVNPNGGAP